jgi:hypothetical protein
MKLKKINEEHYVVENNDGVITYSTKVAIEDYWNVIELPLSEVKELLGEVDVQIKAEKEREKLGYTNKFITGFVSGYTKAIEDNKEKKYTEEDLRKAIEFGYQLRCNNRPINSGHNWVKDFIAQSLQPKTEWEVDIINGKLTLI